MHIGAYCWKITEEEKALVEKLLQVCFPEKEFLIIDLSITPFDKKNLPKIFLAFGIRSFNILSSSIESTRLYQLTVPKNLFNIPANVKNRQDTFDRLKEIASLPIEDEAISDKDLEKFQVDLLRSLKKTCVETNVSMWKGTTNTGKKIAITLKPTDSLVDCNFTITFDELIAMQYAKQIFNLTSISLVSGDKNGKE
jgi:hypothetical protein